MSKEFELVRYINRLKEERDIKVSAAKRYAEGLEDMYNKEINELEEAWEILHNSPQV